MIILDKNGARQVINSQLFPYATERAIHPIVSVTSANYQAHFENREYYKGKPFEWRITMLIAHLVPGYFAAVQSKSNWYPEWKRSQRIILWSVAIGSTVLPDLDVIYNALFRGFINHSILWTHSLFPYLGLGLVWLVLYHLKKWSYLQTIIGLVFVGGLSHLLLDIVAHGTPLMYPLSMTLFGYPPNRVVTGGFWAYVTDPIFLLEPLLISLLIWHWMLSQSKMCRELRLILVFGLLIGLILFSIVFLLFLPQLQRILA
ncbi:MAG: metal-dependent hydrolase [Anaerolineaceae bacterium]|nr:metal-dependent hydrolase [Anaerolineaceae bacterium]